ncbi:MAG: hypothetical protein ACP6IU_00965 [Candidatus Asgardarchaeia archaeon]
MKYFNIQFHVNMWYAEYTNEQVIRRFPNIYRHLLDVLEKYPSLRVGWDIEVSVTLPYLLQVAPDIIERIKKGVHEGRYEIIVDTWSFTLPPLHTEFEFNYQHRKAILKLIENFGKISKGYFAQEAAYSPVMPKFLSKDTDFIVLQTAMLETLSTKYDPTYTGTYLLKGIDNHIIKCVPFESRYLNIVERVNDFLKETKDNSILVVLGDAEIFNPLELDHQLKEILKKPIQPILLSDYIKEVPEGPLIDDLPEGTWALGTYDFFLWCRDPWDHYLWTLNEQARNSYLIAQYWINKLKSLGELTTKEEKELTRILDTILLAQNSDKFGWNPCPEKRLEGELYFRQSINSAKILYSLVSEKVFQKESETYLDVGNNYVQHFLMFNPYKRPIANLPIYFPITIDNDKVAPNQLNLLLHGQKIPFAFEDVKLDEEGNIQSAVLNFILDNTINPSEEVSMFLVKGTPVAPTVNLATLKNNTLENKYVSVTIDDNGTLTNFENKQLNINLPIKNMAYSFTFNEPVINERITKIIPLLQSDYLVYSGLKVVDDYKDFSVITTYKLFNTLDYLEITRVFTFNTSFTGELNPFEINLSSPQEFHVLRDLSGYVIPRTIKEDDEYTILCNNWIKTDIGETGLLLGSNGLVHAIKEVTFSEGSKIILAPMASFYTDNDYERFKGKYIFRIFMKLVPPGNMSESQLQLAYGYANPPPIFEMLQKAGHRYL